MLPLAVSRLRRTLGELQIVTDWMGVEEVVDFTRHERLIAVTERHGNSVIRMLPNIDGPFGDFGDKLRFICLPAGLRWKTLAIFRLHYWRAPFGLRPCGSLF